MCGVVDAMDDGMKNPHFEVLHNSSPLFIFILLAADSHKLILKVYNDRPVGFIQLT